MKKEYIIGVVVMTVIAVALTVILDFNLLQPITNTNIAGNVGNWTGYSGASQLVGTIPIFNALMPILVSIGGMFAILAGAGVARA